MLVMCQLSFIFLYKEHDYARLKTIESDHAELKKELKAAKQELAATKNNFQTRGISTLRQWRGKLTKSILFKNQ